MHLEIDSLYFDGDKISVNFEYDQDFQKQVAKVCGVNRISKKNLQIFIISAIKKAISSEDILELRNQMS